MPSRPRHQGRCLKQPTHHITDHARHPTKQSTSLHHPPSQPSNHSHQPPHTQSAAPHACMRCALQYATPHTPTTTHITPNTSRVSCKPYSLNSEFATAATLPHVGPMPSRPWHQDDTLAKLKHFSHPHVTEDVVLQHVLDRSRMCNDAHCSSVFFIMASETPLVTDAAMPTPTTSSTHSIINASLRPAVQKEDSVGAHLACSQRIALIQMETFSGRAIEPWPRRSE